MSDPVVATTGSYGLVVAVAAAREEEQRQDGQRNEEKSIHARGYGNRGRTVRTRPGPGPGRVRYLSLSARPRKESGRRDGNPRWCSRPRGTPPTRLRESSRGPAGCRLDGRPGT